MDAKIKQLQLATDEAKEQLDFAQVVVETAEMELKAAKDKYKSMSQEEQQTLQMNDTELPELLETVVRAKNVYGENKQRYETNLRYLTMMKEKAGAK
mmetsp:Transcript_23752/g.67135  ORF Transcript_23752/g.67135 Transcript_23752/m.67135 type:complete len:97 (-) Transcript_23752:41-331(-)